MNFNEDHVYDAGFQDGIDHLADIVTENLYQIMHIHPDAVGELEWLIEVIAREASTDFSERDDDENADG